MRPIALAPLALVASLVACSESATVSTTTLPPVQVVKDVTYAPGLRADLYLPPTRTDKPVIVWLHGGGFTDGDKGQLSALAQALAQRGYPGMDIQYRLSSGGPWFPAASLDDPELRAATAKAVEDTDHALQWLKSDEARQQGIDRDHAVLAGYSAGGITAVSAAAGGEPGVEGAVAIAGAAIDPSTVTTGTPPLLLLHGDQDDVVPITLAMATCAAAAVQQATCTLETVAGAGHGLPFDDPQKVTDSIDSFLRGLT